MQTSIANNLARLRGELADAARQAGRDPASVHLLAVSKRQPLEAIVEAAAAGQRAFAENYLQEAETKITALAERSAVPPLQWHFIGAVQSNKTRRIAALFDWVHTVDRPRIAERLSAACPEGKLLQVCVQVNVDADPGKAGVTAEGAAELVEACRVLPGIAPRGLMTIGDPAGDAAQSFARLAQLFADLAHLAPDTWDTLSMGMSNDYHAAIAAGATQVRIGTALFGPRPAG
jgi:pyridoxal phosphate enzyme (YggS family)